MLYALLFGMAFNFLSDDERFARGIRVASRNILRFGVALLGLRITTGDAMELGWPVLALIVASVVATVLIGGLIGRAWGLTSNQSILSAGAALGVKTSLKALANVGAAPIGVMVVQTVFLAVFVIVSIALIR